jgi:AraC-like DNA-binding protein
MNDLQLHIVQCDHVSIDALWNARDVYSSFWRLYINNRDGAAILTGAGRYPLPAGHVHLIPAYFRFSCDNHQRIGHFYIHFDLLGITPLLQKALFTAPISLAIDPLARRIQRQHAAGERIASSPSLLCLTQSLVLQSLAQVFARLKPQQQVQLAASFAAANPVQPAVQLVEQQLPERLSVSEMAEACSMSEDHFIRTFRLIIGQTPANYVLERRIGMAARRLLYGNESIEAVSAEHGFANRFHFTRAFTRAMGISPAAYRNSARV